MPTTDPTPHQSAAQGGSSTLAFTVERSLAPAAPFLVKAAPFASFTGLHYECHGLAGVHLLLLPSAALPRLPHVRSLTIQSGVRTAITLSLPMPRLESITVWELDEELGPICADLVAIAKPPTRCGTGRLVLAGGRARVARCATDGWRAGGCRLRWIRPATQRPGGPARNIRHPSSLTALQTGAARRRRRRPSRPSLACSWTLLA